MLTMWASGRFGFNFLEKVKRDNIVRLSAFFRITYFIGASYIAYKITTLKRSKPIEKFDSGVPHIIDHSEGKQQTDTIFIAIPT